MKNLNVIIATIPFLFLVLIVFGFYEYMRPYTDSEITSMKERCVISGKTLSLGADGSYARCDVNPVESCINKWIASIDEKYDNPDTVSNLRETEYTEVVKQCQETFGKK